MGRDTKAILSARDWAEAALDRIGRHGSLDSVAIEPLARDLGVTKGSFYWHFANRRALLVAALDRWEQRETDEVLARVSQETDPRARIRRLVSEVNASRQASQLYMTLSSASQPELVRAYVERVAQRRFDFIVDCYAALGLGPALAREWALMMFSVFLGALQLRTDLPGEWPAANDPAFDDYVKFLMIRLVPPELDDQGDADGLTPLAMAYNG